tara:strand:+ start:1309 stop:1458 length:150 start_codon:yes stop_codon:yes gene_type:complete
MVSSSLIFATKQNRMLKEKIQLIKRKNKYVIIIKAFWFYLPFALLILPH